MCVGGGFHPSPFPGIRYDAEMWPSSRGAACPDARGVPTSPFGIHLLGAGAECLHEKSAYDFEWCKLGIRIQSLHDSSRTATQEGISGENAHYFLFMKHRHRYVTEEVQHVCMYVSENW